MLKAEAKTNPFSNAIASEDTSSKTNGQIENAQDFSTLVRQYTDMPDYHQSADGKYFGLLIPTKHGISSLGNVKELYKKILSINSETEQKFGVKCCVGGNHMNKLKDYDTILHDIDVASIIALGLIVLLLIYSFRSVLVYCINLISIGIRLALVFCYCSVYFWLA